MKNLLHLTAISCVSLILSACVQQSGSSSSQQPSPAPVVIQSGTGTSGAGDPGASVVRFSDFPMPPQAQLDTEKSIILGTGEDWTGRVVIATPNSPESVFDYYRKELQGHGWREITAVRAATSVLTYIRDGRVATLQLERASSGGTNINVTISPEGKTGSED